MTNSCRRPAMRWNEVTGAIARHKRASTQCGRLNTFASVSPWTCSGISRRPIAHRPRRPCIRPVLGRKNSKNDATVSLKAEIEQLLKQAEQIDAAQDAALGSRRGDELPDELKRREERLAKIQEAKARLEAEALAK